MTCGEKRKQSSKSYTTQTGRTVLSVAAGGGRGVSVAVLQVNG